MSFWKKTNLRNLITAVKTSWKMVTQRQNIATMNPRCFLKVQKIQILMIIFLPMQKNKERTDSIKNIRGS